MKNGKGNSISGVITTFVFNQRKDIVTYQEFSVFENFRHRRGSNTRSSLYESDALPLGHCASRVAKKIFDVTKSMQKMLTSA